MDKKKTRWAGAFVIATAILTLTPALTPGAEVVESKADAATATGITVAAAGDICMDTSALAASCGRTADLIKSRNPSRVFTLGDAQYPNGSLSTFKTWYQPRWGAFKAKTYPATGNHDTFGSGYSTYFDGAAPGPTIPRHYERDLGAWRVVSVDSNSISGARNFVQGLPNTTDHRVFIWHHDPYTQASDHDDITNRRPLYADAVAKGADVILYSHDHIYNRGFKDVPFFLVGTGGGKMPDDYCSPERIPTPEVQRCIHQKLGVLFLTLSNDGSFTYDFVEPTGGMGTSLDRGSIASQ